MVYGDVIVSVSSGSTNVLQDVARERIRQNGLWGEQHHPDGTKDSVEYRRKREHYQILCKKAAQEKKVTWADILLEEVFEAMAEEDPAKLRTELVQAAAVITAWAEDIDSRTALREEDLKIEITRDSDRSRGGMYVPSGNTTVKITHLPTGKFAVAEERSALQAKAVALKDLRMLVFYV